MSYQVEWEQDASDTLERLDSTIVQRILLKTNWLSANLDNIRLETLSGNLKGYFKFKVGDYRVLYTVNRKDRLIIIEYVGHRRDIYKLP